MNAAMAIARSLRQHDRDRYLTVLFAPADRRDALVALYAFNFEIAKTREVVREPMVGRMRLQWWRDAIGEIYEGGGVRRHEVALPLAESIRRFGLSRGHFERLVDARETDLEEAPPASLAAFESYAADSSGRLVQLALEVLGARDPATQAAGCGIGIGWALTGLLRALPTQLRLRRATLPAALVAAAGLDEASLWELRSSPELAAIAREIAAAAQGHFAAARRMQPRIPRGAGAAMLPAAIAAFHLRRLASAGYNPLNPRLARPDTLAVWRLAAAALSRRT